VRASLPARPFLYPIIDVPRIGAERVAATVAELAAVGVRLIQLRAKTAPDGELLAMARVAVAAAREAGVTLIVNDRADVAVLAGAAGVHVGQGDLRPSEARQVLGAEGLVGWSTHCVGQVEAALAEPIDYLAVGPIFATSSKADTEAVAGVGLVGEARRRTRGPLVAIGGITPENAAAVIAAGADGVAVIGGLLGTEGLAEAVQRYRQAVPGLA
jgi:thiamine-phosphate pyrophosphorylase